MCVCFCSTSMCACLYVCLHVSMSVHVHTNTSHFNDYYYWEKHPLHSRSIISLTPRFQSFSDLRRGTSRLSSLTRHHIPSSSSQTSCGNRLLPTVTLFEDLYTDVLNIFFFFSWSSENLVFMVMHWLHSVLISASEKRK